MTQEKKTIQIANGVAEEGDRVSRPERWESGYLVFNDNEAPVFRSDDGIEHPLSETEEDSDLGYLWSGELMFSFSPTDVLEAVEEEIEFTKVQKNTVDDMHEHEEHNERVKLDAVLVSLQNVKQRINQKRKGHE